MGKKTNERRKQLIEELRQNGKLGKPAIKRFKPAGQRAKQKNPEPVNCCIIKHGDSLPVGFRRCHGCPLTEAPNCAMLSVPV